jgi:hypothetical protein
MNLDKTKIRIKDKEHYELVQDALYDKGIYCSSQRNKDTYRVGYGYLFIDRDLITYSNYEYGISHPYKEITLEDILDIREIQYEIY